MPTLTYSIGKDGLIVPVLVGLNGEATADLYAKGLAVAPPVLVRGLIDTGSNFTGAAPWIFRQLGITCIGKSTTQTASGEVEVEIFSVSIGIRETIDSMGANFTLPTVIVSELPRTLQDADVLIGLNVLLECNLLLEGPAKTFLLIF